MYSSSSSSSVPTPVRRIGSLVVGAVVIGVIGVAGLWIYQRSKTNTAPSSTLSNVRTPPSSPPSPSPSSPPSPSPTMVPGPPGPPGSVPQNLSNLTLDCTDPDNTNCRIPNGKRGLIWNPPEQYTRVYTDINDTVQLEAPEVRFRVKDTNLAAFTADDGVVFPRRDGGATVFDNSQGNNIFYGHTQIDDVVTFTNPVVSLPNGWTIDTSDGHFRVKLNGHQKFVMHQDGRGWKASGKRGPDNFTSQYPWRTFAFNWICPSDERCPTQNGYDWTDYIT